MNYTKIGLGAVAFFLTSFVFQGMLGFALAGDYFANIPIMRNPPIFPLALGQALLSGLAFAALYPFTAFAGVPWLRGLKYGLFVGFIMVPFIALDLPARFDMPSISTWIWVQIVVGVLHFGVAGLLVALIYSRGANAA